MVVVEVNGYTIEPGADLEGVKLGGANLPGANLSGADLGQTVADEDTTWPGSFDPAAAGLRLDSHG